jgi:aryl-alcohol dehydrogenase-like predicted oxidoreductase
MVPMAKALNIGVTAWSPLSNGVLTGKYDGRGGSGPGPHEQRHVEGFHAGAATGHPHCGSGKNCG